MSSRVPLLACIAVLSFFAGITGVRLAYTLTYVLVLLLLVAFGWSRLVARRLVVRRESPDGTYVVGQPFSERFTVVNRSPLPVGYCEIGDPGAGPDYSPGRACSIPGGGTVAWTARGTFSRRGRHRFGPLEARLGDPFGLFPTTQRFGSPSEVVIYPAIHPLDDLAPAWTASGRSDSRAGAPLDLPPDASTVRDYDPGDGMNRIHWPSTARTGRLMSRSYDSRQTSDLLVVLDLQSGIHAGEAPESSLEYCVSLAASLVHAGIRRGQAVGLVTNDYDQTAFGAGRGEQQRQRLLSYLATAADDGTLSLADTIARHGRGWRGRGGIVVVTSSPESAWVDALVDTASRGVRHLCLLVDAASFGARRSPLRVTAAWRLALDWLIVRRGDVLGAGEGSRAAGF